MNCWTTPELFVMPVPLTLSRKLGGVVMLNALAPGSKAMPFTSTLDESDISVMFEAANVAVSLGPFGTVLGIQLAAVFQSPLIGSSCQVALPANPACIVRPKHKMQMSKRRLVDVAMSTSRPADFEAHFFMRLAPGCFPPLFYLKNVPQCQLEIRAPQLRWLFRPATSLF